MFTNLYFQILGTRGSRPVFDRNFLKFGGNTSSYKIWADGMFPVYIDGGTGLFREGHRLVDHVKQFTFLLTHSHWDHILAFPFFDPFYHSDTSARIWGTPSFKETFKELFEHQFQTDAFPVHYSELPAHIEFTTITDKQTFMLSPFEGSPNDAYTISTYLLNHPGIDLGYRIEYGGKSIVILTDIAPIENNHLGRGMKKYQKEDEKRYYQGLVDFCQDTDLLLHDTHFNEQTIRGKENWGHSTEAMAVKIAADCRAKQLILGHHAPEDTDEIVSKKLENARRLSEPYTLNVLIPEEDEIIEV